MMIITKDDLYKNLYNYEILKANIYAVSLVDILKSQKLDSDFCAKYILNKDFQFLDEEQNITMDDVKKYQSHITDVELVDSMLRIAHKRILGKKIDSIEDFESYMLRNL